MSWSRSPQSVARYLRTLSDPAINTSTKLSMTIVTSARSTGSSRIGRSGPTVTGRSRYRIADQPDTASAERAMGERPRAGTAGDLQWIGDSLSGDAEIAGLGCLATGRSAVSELPAAALTRGCCAQPPRQPGPDRARAPRRRPRREAHGRHRRPHRV